MTAFLARILMISLCATQASASLWRTSWHGRDLSCDPRIPRQLRILKPLPAGNVCENRGTSIVARTAFGQHLLFLCENSRMVDNFDISIGAGGVGKTTEGDQRTPLGTYHLGRPRFSDANGIFIAIAYPTLEQRALGYTGHSVGIHGPTRRFRCAGFLNAMVDWTDGCLALADDGFVARIASWLEAHPEGSVIHIE